MTIVPFATSSYHHRSLPISAQRCVNAYAEKEPPDAKTPVAVIGAPGLTAFATCGNGPIRGMHVLNGLLYAVSGTSLYSVSSTGVATVVGGSVLGTGIVKMADNGTQLCIVNGTQGYIYAPLTGFAIISDVNFHSANTVTFFDNVFVFDWARTSKFFISNTLDGTSYNGLAFASAEVSSDYVLATINQQENLIIFGGGNTSGDGTIEVWYDAGLPVFPFLRVDGGVVERGCGAALTPIKEDNSVFFLGDDVIFYRLNNMAPQRISTHALESEWQKYSTVSDAFTFSYTHEGHKFVVLTFPSGNTTWVYDVSTNLWHERISWDQFGNNLGRWRGNCHQSCYNLNLIGDAFSGQIGSLDASVFTEFGSTMQLLCVTPMAHNDRKRIYVSRFELDVDSGIGLTTGQGRDPQVMLRWSRDGGRTFSDLQQWHSIGVLGAYLQRLRWLKLGQGRQWCFQITCSDPVKRTIISAHADSKSGM